MPHDINYVVVCYGRDCDSSVTYTSLLQNGVNASQILCYDNTENNLKLTSLYNDALSRVRSSVAKKIVFLDDDTSLSSDYLKEVENLKNGAVLIPILKEGEKVFSPLKIKSWDRFCMSGVCLNLEHFDGFFFDEKYSLYGIDDFFSIYCLKENKKLKFCDAPLEHSLSTLVPGKFHRNISAFKSKELLRAHCLNLRYATFSLKQFFLKKIIYYFCVLLAKGVLTDAVSIVLNPGEKEKNIGGRL